MADQCYHRGDGLVRHLHLTKCLRVIAADLEVLSRKTLIPSMYNLRKHWEPGQGFPGACCNHKIMWLWKRPDCLGVEMLPQMHIFRRSSGLSWCMISGEKNEVLDLCERSCVQCSQNLGNERKLSSQCWISVAGIDWPSIGFSSRVGLNGTVSNRADQVAKISLEMLEANVVQPRLLQRFRHKALLRVMLILLTRTVSKYHDGFSSLVSILEDACNSTR